MTHSYDPSSDIDQLDSFLRGERSAVETYDQAIEKLKGEPLVTAQLRLCRDSHARRARMLEAQIRDLGGDPSDDSGLWGTFAKLVEGGAKLFGKTAALEALQEGEKHGVNDYERDVDDLSPGVRAFVEHQLLPEQRRSAMALGTLTMTR
ncbi:MAG: DUF2383 domain-containing protein [Sandaracinus sp.]|nr:DUF2383 domain-containing protein [Myxococcales bacterium]MCB9604053.1 DUF2383 domain-containing protein [Sandaracinus sp.]MCB9612913.1 DUF2383 domain-containing protein [Sandaracinus sp.]MCB9631820.1 DUF2383 domain-containing protein [Sandaracinus sp.]